MSLGKECLLIIWTASSIWKQIKPQHNAFFTVGHFVLLLCRSPYSYRGLIPTLHHADPHTHHQQQIFQGDRTNKHQLVGNRVPGRLEWCHEAYFYKHTSQEITTRDLNLGALCTNAHTYKGRTGRWTDKLNNHPHCSSTKHRGNYIKKMPQTYWQPAKPVRCVFLPCY